MRRTWPASWPGRSGARLIALGWLWLAPGGCQPRDAVVGAFPRDGAAMDGRALVWSTQFAADEGLWQPSTPIAGATITFGVPRAAASDDAVVELRLPGQPGQGPDSSAGPDLATQIATRRSLQFGTFRTRVSFAACAATEEVASAVFAFFNDGRDGNGNGIPDNPEIDFQVLCGTPTFIVLTCWTDFQPATAGSPERFIKRSRAIDTATGDIYDTTSDGANDFARTATQPELVVRGFPGAGPFYEVGFEWQASRVRFFIVDQARELTLWTLADATMVPQVPLQMMLNLWHPSQHWLPTRSPANYPARDAVLSADWAQYWNP